MAAEREVPVPPGTRVPPLSRNKGTKTERAELERRYRLVAMLLIQGGNRAEILRHVAENTAWAVSERTVENYIARARKLLAEDGQRDRDEERGVATARLELLFNKAYTAKHYDTARRIQRDLTRLQGLNPEPTLRVKGELAHSGKVAHTVETLPRPTNDTERATVLNDLLGKALQRGALRPITVPARGAAEDN